MSALVGISCAYEEDPEEVEIILLNGIRALRGKRRRSAVQIGKTKLVIISEHRRTDGHRLTRHEEQNKTNGRVDVVLGCQRLGEALRVVAYRQGGEVSLERGLLARRTLYFAWRRDGSLVFADRIDPVLAMLDWKPRLSLVGLSFFVTQVGVPAPWTLVEHVWKIGPGRRVVLHPAWRAEGLPGAVGAALPPVQSGTLTSSEVRELVQEGILRRSHAVARSGILLSGGLDSTIVLSQLKRLDTPPRTAYILRYKDPIFAQYDWDAHYAWLVARTYNVDSRNIGIDSGTPISILFNHLQREADEPVADPALIPLFLAAKEAAKDGVDVLWDGRGADELFASVFSDVKLELWRLWFEKPFPLRSKFGLVLRGFLGKRGTSKHEKWFAQSLETSVFWQESAVEPEQLEKLGLLSLEALFAYFLDLGVRSRDRHPGGLAQRTEWEIWLAEHNQRLAEVVERLTGVTFRSPFLDEDLVWRAMRVPFRRRVPFGSRKPLLRRAFENEVPREVLRRQKRGLGSPVDWWIYQMRSSIEQDLEAVREVFEDSGIAWEGWQALLSDPRTEPGIQWLLLSVLGWVRLHLKAAVHSAESHAQIEATLSEQHRIVV